MKTPFIPRIVVLLFTFFFIIACDQSEKEPTVTTESTTSIVEPVTIAILAHTDFVPDRTGVVDRSKIGLPDILTERMIEHLTNSKRFIPVDRTALRRTFLEQRFGQNLAKTYLDQTLDKVIAAMENVDGGSIRGTKETDVAPQPVGGGISEGTGGVGTTGTLSNYNDILKDFQDLGTAVGADYLVLGNLEKLHRTTETKIVPYSTEGRTQQKNIVEARLNLRIIDSKSGTIIGATSLRTQISEAVFTGKRSDTDEYSFYDHLGRLAAVKVLDVIYPARIVSEEPLVISRGSNDGTQVNDIYIIEREGKSVSDDSGQVIAHLKDKIGLVQVISTQETVAIVKPINGEDFRKGDLAMLDAEASKPQTTIPDSAEVPIKGAAANIKQQPRLAVVLIKSGTTETPTDNSAEKHTPIFTDTIISRLTQTKQFEMLDRQEVDQLLKEQTLQALREDRELASAVGSLQGADYLVYGSLASFSVEDKKIQLPGSTRTFTKKIGYLEGNIRIVDARSGKILESRKISIAHELSDVNAKGSRKVAELADAYAEQVVLILMNKLYPIRVAAVGSDKTIYINRGDDGGLFVGEILDAYRLGAPVIDPETGVQLGQEENALGLVKVVEVEDARSKGIALEATKVVEGDLLKRAIKNQGKPSSQSAASGTAARSRAEITDSGAPGQPAKPTGARFTIVVGQLKITPGAKGGQQPVKQMTDDLIIKLTNTNRFNVLERQEIDQLIDEKGFDAAASGGDIEKLLKELKGSDYLIHGDLDIFDVTTQTREVPYLDEVETIATAVAQGVLRIVDVHTGEVKAGDRVRVSFKVDNVSNLEPVFARLQDEFSTEAVAQILIRLFPIKVLGIAGDGIVYLNRGNDAGLQNGDIFDVMRPGAQLIDPDTGRSFGTAESKVASVEVIAVEGSRSRASVKSGSEVLAGDILRKQQQTTQKPTKPKVFTPNW
jgi:curli biogenesis system outer membrane secretion channel CsgG